MSKKKWTKSTAIQFLMKNCGIAKQVTGEYHVKNNMVGLTGLGAIDYLNNFTDTRVVQVK